MVADKAIRCCNGALTQAHAAGEPLLLQRPLSTPPALHTEPVQAERMMGGPAEDAAHLALLSQQGPGTARSGMPNSMPHLGLLPLATRQEVKCVAFSALLLTSQLQFGSAVGVRHKQAEAMSRCLPGASQDEDMSSYC